MRKIDRREFLQGVGLSLGGLVLAGAAGGLCLRPGLTDVQTLYPNRAGWAYQRPIYEVNPAFFGPSNNNPTLLSHITGEMPKLAALNIGMIHLMPIHPDSSTPYAPTDYKAVDGQYGGLPALKDLVTAAHQHDIKVILDFVPNHTGMSHPWVQSNPDYYIKDANGNPVHPNPGEPDVYQLDHKNSDLREALLDAMRYWVLEADIDGYRVDAAERVVRDVNGNNNRYEGFYVELRNLLTQIKPVFLLAEGTGPDLHPRFDATYAWEHAPGTESLDHLLKSKVSGIGGATMADIKTFLNKEVTDYPADAMRVHYVLNHDLATADTHEIADYGGEAQYEVAMMVAFTTKGIPYLYNGQESGNLDVQFGGTNVMDHGPYDGKGDDSVSSWRSHIATLFGLYRNHPALARGSYDDFAPNGKPANVLSFGRKFVTSTGAVKTVIVVANLGGTGYINGVLDVPIPASYRMNGYRNLYSSETYNLAGKTLWSPSLPPYGYLIISN